MEIWQGKGRTSQNAYKFTNDQDLTFTDIYGRTYIIPAGSEIKQFETINRGWNIWRDPNGKLHVNDCG